MSGIQRQGDQNIKGGIAGVGIPSVRANGNPVSTNGTNITGHAPWGRPHPKHASSVTSGGSSSVRAGSIPVNSGGNPDACGQPRSNGSGDVSLG